MWGRQLVPGALSLADPVTRCADSLQRKAHHRQGPLTDPHVVQWRKYSRRENSPPLNIWKLVELLKLMGFHFETNSEVLLNSGGEATVKLTGS